MLFRSTEHFEGRSDVQQEQQIQQQPLAMVSDMSELDALHKLVQNFATKDKTKEEISKRRDNTPRINTIQQTKSPTTTFKHIAKKNQKHQKQLQQMPSQLPQQQNYQQQQQQKQNWKPIKTKTTQQQQQTLTNAGFQTPSKHSQGKKNTPLMKTKSANAGPEFSMVKTIERLQSEIGEFGEAEEKGLTIKEDDEESDDGDQTTIMLEDADVVESSASGSGADYSGDLEGSAKESVVKGGQMKSKWVPVVIQNEKQVSAASQKQKNQKEIEPLAKHAKKVRGNAPSNESKKVLKKAEREESKSSDEKGVDHVDNQDIEDSSQMEENEEDGDDEAEEVENEDGEQKTIEALFKLHEDEDGKTIVQGKPNSRENRKDGEAGERSKGKSTEEHKTSAKITTTNEEVGSKAVKSDLDQMSNAVNTDNKQMVMFQGKQQSPSVGTIEDGDVNPSVIKDALQIFSHKNKQSLASKKHEETTSLKNLASDHLQDVKELSNKDGGKTIILALPVKLSDKVMLEKQVEAIKEKLLSIGNLQQDEQIQNASLSSPSSTAIKTILSSSTDGNSTTAATSSDMEVTKDENKNSKASTLFTLPSSETNLEQHLQDIAKNPISSVATQSVVLDELKGEVVGGGIEKQSKGFLEAIAKMKNEKLQGDSKSVASDSTLAGDKALQVLATEHEDNFDETKLAPAIALAHNTNDKNENSTVITVSQQKKPMSFQQQLKQQLHQQQKIKEQQEMQNPLLQPVPKVAFEQTTTMDKLTKLHLHNPSLVSSTTTTKARPVLNEKEDEIESKEEEEEEEEDDEGEEEEEEEVEANKDLTATSSPLATEKPLFDLKTQAATKNSQKQEQERMQSLSTPFKSRPFNPSRIPMTFHKMSVPPKDHHQQQVGDGGVEDVQRVMSYDGTRCKASCKTMCAPDCRFECCRVAEQKNQITKKKLEKKKRKGGAKKSKTSEKIKNKEKKTSFNAKNKNGSKQKNSEKSLKIETKLKSINRRIDKLITTSPDSEKESVSALFNLPRLPKMGQRINYDSKKGHRFLKETQEKLHSLITMLSQSSVKLSSVDDSVAKKSTEGTTTCDERCKVVCLPTCHFECCKHDDEKKKR